MTPPSSPLTPNDPRLTRARTACRAGNLRGAAPLYEAFLKSHPDSAEAHYELGQVFARMTLYDRSVTHLRRASELAPDNVDYMVCLAGQLTLLRDYHEGIAVYNKLRAITNSPEHHADAAALYEVLGEYDKGREAASAALESTPNHERATVTRIKIDLRQSTPDEPRLRAWLEGLDRVAATDNPHLKSQALELIADINEKLADYPAAFQTFTRINETDRAARQRMLPNQQAREGYLKSLDLIRAAVTPELARRWAEHLPKDSIPAPAFLVGFPRSGTTMTERALGAHPAIRSIEERPTFEACKGQVAKLVGAYALQTRPLGEVFDALSPKQVTSLRSFYWDQVRREIGPVPDNELVLDKNPLRIADLPFVNRIFPEAKVIVALRDPRDVCLSCYRQRFDFTHSIAMSLFLDLRSTGMLYAKIMQAWIDTRESYTFPWKEIRYEDTVTDFETRIREVIEFLELPWDDAVLSFHKTSGRKLSTTPSYHAIRQKVYTSAIGRWQRYADQLAPILPILQPYVEAFGYADDAPPA
jgi:tetratricopeptide (TPR) repeat protein